MLTDDFLLVNLAKAFWIAFIASVILAYPVLATLIKLKSRQTVSQYAPETHQKKQGTPTMGGIIVVLGATVAVLILAATSIFNRYSAAEYLVLFLGFTAIGFIDDWVVPRYIKGKRGLGWKQKILMQLVVAILALLIRSGVEGWEPVAVVLLILFFSNAYNFADGLDGLAGSIGVLVLAGIAFIGFLVGYGSSATLFAACLIGALAPFIFLNAPPAKVFMGDVGSLPIGAVMGLMYSELAFPYVHLGAFDPSSEWYLGRNLVAYRVMGVEMLPMVVVALVVLGLLLAAELIPVPLQIASVKLRGKKIFTYTPIHHGYEKKGWPESTVVWRFALLQLLLTAMAITLVLVPLTTPRPADPAMRTAERR